MRSNKSMCAHVFMYEYVFVNTHVCKDAGMYVFACMYALIFVCMHLWNTKHTHKCERTHKNTRNTHTHIHVRSVQGMRIFLTMKAYVCIFVRMFVCIFDMSINNIIYCTWIHTKSSSAPCLIIWT